MSQAAQSMPSRHDKATGQNPSYEDLLTTVEYLLDEQKRLTQRLTFAERTARELYDQAQYANNLARSAQKFVNLAQEQKKSAKKSNAGMPTTWIGGSWLAPSEAVLAPAEKAWQEGNAQKALNIVGPLFQRHDMTVSEDVHMNLFTSAILRASGDLAQSAKYAEDALVIAKEAGSYMLASKAEFHRGLCYLKQNRFAQAQWCLVLASHLEGHQDQIEANRVFAEERRLNLGPSDPGRKLDLTYI
ncbi:MAG: hypothetical protein LQ344_002452 [Seirophora lacunosa]|nr:MAG: hypothetical protein LQ344_002452 [Seirophora lacunosa]